MAENLKATLFSSSVQSAKMRIFTVWRLAQRKVSLIPIQDSEGKDNIPSKTARVAS